MPEAFPPTLAQLRETFDLLEEWDERYEYLIELGKQLPKLPADTCTEENRVHGCMSTVWLAVDLEPESGHLKIIADSDSLIVKGLIVILMATYADKNPEQVLTFDPADVLAEFGLNQHLSPNRRNGLYSMVQRIRELALEKAAG